MHFISMRLPGPPPRRPGLWWGQGAPPRLASLGVAAQQARLKNPGLRASKPASQVSSLQEFLGVLRIVLGFYYDCITIL